MFESVHFEFIAVATRNLASILASTILTGNIRNFSTNFVNLSLTKLGSKASRESSFCFFED